MPQDRIFINYRRADTRWAASRLYDELGRRFGHDRLFMDVDSIPAGADFVDHLHRHVDQCAAVLVLIGRDWLTLANDDGVRRIDDADDFVTLEIARALERDIPVIPVLVDGADPPLAGDLPAALQPLCRRQAVRIDHETYRGDFDQIAAAVAPFAGRRRRPGFRAAAVGGAAALALGAGAGLYLMQEPKAPILGAWGYKQGAIVWSSIERADYTWNSDIGVVVGDFDGRVFTGRWREEKSDALCQVVWEGTRHWGRVEFRFNAEMTAFTGVWGHCDQPMKASWNGERR